MLFNWHVGSIESMRSSLCGIHGCKSLGGHWGLLTEAFLEASEHTVNPEEPGEGIEPSTAPEQSLSQVVVCGNGQCGCCPLIHSEGLALRGAVSELEGTSWDVAFQREDLGIPGGFVKMSLKKNWFFNL